MAIRILPGDCRTVMRGLPDESVHCVVTSPPYWGLRDYGTAKWYGGEEGCDHVSHEIRTGLGMAALGEKYRGGGHKAAETKEIQYNGHCAKCGARRIDSQIGLEPTIGEYVETMVDVFREVRRVLRKDGTLWLNLGDSYANDGKWGGETGGKQAYLDDNNRKSVGREKRLTGLKPKDLCGVPWRVAFALQADGWYLRQDIIWAKPNPMPESVTDRCTKAHEYLFLLAKSGESQFWAHREGGGARPRPEPDYRWVHKKTGVETAEPQAGKEWRRINLWTGHDYFYDAEAIKEALEPKTFTTFGIEHRPQGNDALGNVKSDNWGSTVKARQPKIWSDGNMGRNKRSVWQIATAPFPEAHFATFPPALVEPCIKAGTSEKGCCAKCGAPWVREIEKTRTFESGSGRAGNMPVGKNGANLQGGGATLDIRRGPCVNAKTIGWSPSCSCTARALTFPCTVLDPFGGAGTTGLVADRLGRDAVMVELNPQYAAMAGRRITKDAGLFAQVAAE